MGIYNNSIIAQCCNPGQQKYKFRQGEKGKTVPCPRWEQKAGELPTAGGGIAGWKWWTELGEYGTIWVSQRTGKGVTDL